LSDGSALPGSACHRIKTSKVAENCMADQGAGEQRARSELHTAIQSLLQEDLSEQELRDRLLVLLGSAGVTRQPTTDEATDHPGYQ
jgi:hypothetical protein